MAVNMPGEHGVKVVWNLGGMYYRSDTVTGPLEFGGLTVHPVPMDHEDAPPNHIGMRFVVNREEE